MAHDSDENSLPVHKRIDYAQCLTLLQMYMFVYFIQVYRSASSGKVCSTSTHLYIDGVEENLNYIAEAVFTILIMHFCCHFELNK